MSTNEEVKSKNKKENLTQLIFTERATGNFSILIQLWPSKETILTQTNPMLDFAGVPGY